MSLTRNEWIEMWNTVKRIEYLTKKLRNSITRKKIINDLFYIKAQIQSVIGQME